MGNIDLDFTQLDFDELPAEVMVNRASEFYKLMNKRRTTRHFAKKKVDRKLIEFAIKTASTAPSGAHLQPWTFVAISNIELKRRFVRQQKKRKEKHMIKECLNLGQNY